MFILLLLLLKLIRIGGEFVGSIKRNRITEHKGDKKAKYFFFYYLKRFSPTTYNKYSKTNLAFKFLFNGFLSGQMYILPTHKIYNGNESFQTSSHVTQTPSLTYIHLASIKINKTHNYTPDTFLNFLKLPQLVHRSWNSFCNLQNKNNEYWKIRIDEIL